MNDEGDSVQYTFDYDGENFTMDLAGVKIIGCQWVPKDIPPKFAMIFFHGLGAFLTINRPFFPPIVKAGGIIFGTDHIGHGRSPGNRGDNTMENLHEEIRLLIKRAEVLFPNIPLFLYGHSLGGLTVLSFVCGHPEETKAFDGIIIEAPWLNEAPDREGSAATAFIDFLGRYFNINVSIDTGEGFSNTNYPEKFIMNYFKSHLAHDYISPKLYASVVDMRKIIFNNTNKWPNHLYLLFMQGGKDGSVGVEKNMHWAYKLRNLRPNLVKLAYHPELEHAMLRGSAGPIVINEVIDFMISIISDTQQFQP